MCTDGRLLKARTNEKQLTTLTAHGDGIPSLWYCRGSPAPVYTEKLATVAELMNRAFTRASPAPQHAEPGRRRPRLPSLSEAAAARALSCQRAPADARRCMEMHVRCMEMHGGTERPVARWGHGPHGPQSSRRASRETTDDHWARGVLRIWCMRVQVWRVQVQVWRVQVWRVQVRRVACAGAA